MARYTLDSSNNLKNLTHNNFKSNLLFAPKDLNELIKILFFNCNNSVAANICEFCPSVLNVNVNKAFVQSVFTLLEQVVYY